MSSRWLPSVSICSHSPGGPPSRASSPGQVCCSGLGTSGLLGGVFWQGRQASDRAGLWAAVGGTWTRVQPPASACGTSGARACPRLGRTWWPPFAGLLGAAGGTSGLCTLSNRREQTRRSCFWLRCWDDLLRRAVFLERLARACCSPRVRRPMASFPPFFLDGEVVPALFESREL